MSLTYRLVGSDNSDIKNYCMLFSKTFPKAKHLDQTYLSWLYRANPAGSVVGTDAFDGDVLVAHVAMLPFRAYRHGESIRALLALNVATHPEYQGRGLFSKLVNQTVEWATSAGYSCIVGVANASAYPIWTRKLGFEDVAPLTARIGPYCSLRLDEAAAEAKATFKRLWSKQELEWRIGNPKHPLSCASSRGDFIRVWTNGPVPMSSISCHVPASSGGLPHMERRSNRAVLNLHVGLEPQGTATYALSMNIPERFKPSPLRFIYRSIDGNQNNIQNNSILFRFIDFDAF